MRWFISDTHFCHKNVIQYSARPFSSVDEMNKALIANWNSKVKDEDDVFFLGDFGIGTVPKLREIYYQLNGLNKICIMGNHDGNASRMSRIGFHVVLESAMIKIGHFPVELQHYPDENRLRDDETLTYYFRLHGHVHEKMPNKIVNGQLNMSVEVWDYAPVAEKTILSMLDKEFNAMLRESCPGLPAKTFQ